MLSRIRQKLLGIKYNLDVFEQDGDMLTIKGWIFSEKYKIGNVHFVIKDQTGKEFQIKGRYKIRRNDVYQVFKADRAKKSGFYAMALVENSEGYDAWIAFEAKKKEYRFYLGKITDCMKKAKNLPPRITEIEMADEGIDITSMLKKQKDYKFEFPEELYSECVDIIVPVYNGYRFLDKLLSTISLTKMRYRLVLINDKSPDERVLVKLEEYAKDKDNVILLNNEENLGFLQTVNRGFDLSEHHIALVNTDVELPKFWLERLMLPIFQNEQVASTTPYTTCGTVCSFPEFGKDNKLFLGLDVQQIDEEFINVPPKYTEMPTGVGYCMGMNRKVLKEIGKFDTIFGKGYAEENDWCQRAIEAGYKNVQVENLFVFHNHGGSFLSEDKKRFLEEHEKILLKKHPYYKKDIDKYCTLDPNKEIREFIKLKLIKRYTDCETILAFDHSLGGGATKYLIGKKNICLKEGKRFITVRFDYIKSSYVINYCYENYEVKLHVKSRKELMDVLVYFEIDEIWINELVTYPDLYEVLKDIRGFAQMYNVRIKMLIHDFFAVCPTINLLDYKEEYCALPSCETCNECLKRVHSIQSLEYESMETWRKEWKEFLVACNEVVVFSNDSKNIVEKAFGKLENIEVIPHQIDFIPVLNKTHKTTKTLNIGLLGILTKHKGRRIVAEMVKHIEQENLNIRIILIGSSSKEIKSPVFKQTGTYTRDSIPRLVLENDIDVFLIPSIWPETFSYTTEEIMTMKMPVMCFDIGAPAERVKKYEQGTIIPEMSAEAVLDTVKNNKKIQELLRKKHIKRKVLFVVEEVTFSSRYRVDHLREQLWQKGIDSECITLAKIERCKMDSYTDVVVYRSSKTEIIRKLVEKAHRKGVRVYYDIDDYIFDYPAIRNLKFLEGEDYEGFEKYSKNIYRTMCLMDGFMVSTVNLKHAIEKKFPDKEVLINRNVASMEMLTLSLCTKKEKSEKIRLGYFSGSKTHNEDFESIKDVLISLMEKNPNVYLLIGGQIELPLEFNSVKDRIEKFDFVSWKKLPNLIAKADINLMPLEDTFFHACKSENKWMEAALVHVPTIASWNSELAGAIEDGVNGYLCKDMQEWNDKLQNLISDEKLRKDLAECAHERVLERYTTYTLEPEVLKFFME